MPTILRSEGFRFVVYPNDHPPAHVHAIKPGWAVVVKVDGPAPVLREVIGASAPLVRRVMLAAVRHHGALRRGWEGVHG